ncbi:hypothetical protein F4779DRAFT_604706 [Xylariaceae sp. FL0662B]|nr:hypothetical protein F4779DRAFT_604706 [Xylariaceae sp. FL0662B]
MSLIHKSFLIIIASLVANALSSPAAVVRKDELSTVTLTEAPLITEVVPFFTPARTTIDRPGAYTLGLDCAALFGHDCIPEITHIAKPTVATLTGVGVKTTTYPATASTTYTSSIYDFGCDCFSSQAFCWRPDPTPATCPPSSPPTSVTVTATTTTAPANTTVATPTCAPTLSCDKYGYLVQFAKLYRVDLATGDYTLVKERIGDGSSVNAMAYNPLDSLLYARQAGSNELIRIRADGSREVLGTTESANVGDIDASGYYWYGSGGQTWHRVDLIPGSPTYGETVGNGTADTLGLAIADWVYIPLAGPYLWAAARSPDGGAALARFSLDAKAWKVVARYPDIAGRAFGAVYGINNGTLYASDNNSGEIWAFPIVGGGRPYLASRGPPSANNDGARCVFNVLLD